MQRAKERKKERKVGNGLGEEVLNSWAILDMQATKQLQPVKNQNNKYHNCPGNGNVT